MKDAPPKSACPKCGNACPRYYGQMNFICKGDGWPSKTIRGGQSLPKAKKLEDVQNAREKAGLNPGREKPMSDAEFQRRKKLNKRWLEDNQ